MNEWTSVIQSIAEILIPVVGVWVTYEIRRRTSLIKDDQERAAIMQAVETGRLLLQKKLAQGLISPSDVARTGPVVMLEASAALGRVPDAAAAQGTTVSAAAMMIAARVEDPPAPARGLPSMFEPRP